MLSLLRRKKSAWKSNRQKRSSCRPRLEQLEDRTLLSGFVDGFEGPTLDPFWSTRENSGSITFPSTARVHSGRQSVQLNSTQNTGQKNIDLFHAFPEPIYGRVSVWVYDTGADVLSSNYIGLSVGNRRLEVGASLFTQDYDLGPTNGGNYYYTHFGVDSGILSSIDRTQAWHHFEIDASPQSLTLLIDGTAVYRDAGGHQFDTLGLFMSGPTWRPAWVTYFDDFEFVPYAASDIAATHLAWNPVAGGVDFSYEITGTLPRPTTAALYWARGERPSDVLGGPIVSVPIDPSDAAFVPIINVSAETLGTPPPGATHLLLITDPDDFIHESNEDNNSLALPIELPDIAILSATTEDSHSVTYTAEITGRAIDQPFQVSIYRSSDDQLDDGDVLLGSQTISVATPGLYSMRWEGDLPINPARPYILVVADADNAIAEADETNNSAFFRKHVLGVVTHGFQLFGDSPFWVDYLAGLPLLGVVTNGFQLLEGYPSWVDDMATSLQRVGYDEVLPFDWAALSNNPGGTIPAGSILAYAVQNRVQQLVSEPHFMPNDVVDVHFIGHSLGSVVISRALQELQFSADTPEPLRAGWVKMTMLDPHPAHNHATPNYSVARKGLLGVLGRFFERRLIDFQDRAMDPEVVVPSIVDEAEVYYQHTSHRLLRGSERILNLWGEIPVINESAAPVSYYDLTGPGIGHSEVHDWYQSHVIPTLVDPFLFDGPLVVE